MDIRESLGKSATYKRRAYNGVVLLMQGVEERNEFYTPLGNFKQNIVDFLIKNGIIKPWTDDRFYIWADNGRKVWNELKRSVGASFIKGNKDFDIQQNYWENIDFIATAMNRKYTFVFKDDKRLISELDRICDDIEPTPKQDEEVKTFKNWELIINNVNYGAQNQRMERETIQARSFHPETSEFEQGLFSRGDI